MQLNSYIVGIAINSWKLSMCMKTIENIINDKKTSHKRMMFCNSQKITYCYISSWEQKVECFTWKTGMKAQSIFYSKCLTFFLFTLISFARHRAFQLYPFNFNLLSILAQLKKLSPKNFRCAILFCFSCIYQLWVYIFRFLLDISTSKWNRRSKPLFSNPKPYDGCGWTTSNFPHSNASYSSQELLPTQW